MQRIVFAVACLGFLAIGSPSIAIAAETEPQLTSAQRDFFEKKIRPVLVQRCYECHSAKADMAEGKLLLDSRAAMHQGGETGPAIVPGEPNNSLLLAALRYEDLEMPPDGKLADAVIADFERWIKMGAPDPRAATQAMDDAPKYVAAKPEDVWSLAPVADARPPEVKDVNWPRSDIDRFVLARLEAEKLTPVADADPAMLLRRVYFDLVGLPPSPQELDAFLADPSSKAFEQTVDRLLTSPHFGERWGRHWLDVARFAESNGKSRDVLMPHAWRYRDYVIDALNNDLPFDRFITEQIAGDLLPSDSPAERDRLITATGFLAIGSKTLTGATTQVDLIDEQIDATSKAVLGLTVSCARCHDHKFDPVPTRDYYALAGIFLSTDTRYGGGLKAGKDMASKASQLMVLGPKAEQQVKQVSEHQKQLAQLDKRQKELADKQKSLRPKLPKDWQQRLKQLTTDETVAGEADDRDAKQEESKPSEEDQDKGEVQDKPLDKQEKLLVEYATVMSEVKEVKQQLDELKQVDLPELDFAVGVRDAGKVQDSRIHVRGDQRNLGEAAPRGFLSCIELDDAPAIPAKQSGRLQLAEWLTHRDNPLTPRVAVNRIWLHLMGRGLVGTVDNFGANGEPPTHPLLLDYLARRLLDSGWSTKQVIREVVLSRTYQLSSEYDEDNYAADPDNTLRWRMSRRRLEAEALRDAMLAASGQLNRQPPAVAIMARVGDGEVGRTINTKPINEPFPHRSVYLPIIRGMVPEVLKTFDFPEPSNVQGQRDTTNVPSQSLFLMNSPLVLEQAEVLARRVTAAAESDPQRAATAYKLCFSREPTAAELQRLVEFVQRHKVASEKDGKQPDGKQPDDKQPGGKRQTSREQDAWTTACHALLASGEFRFLD
ncbi:MAG: DUF1553 domain-containing protein [Pirellulaceae bacterium]